MTARAGAGRAAPPPVLRPGGRRPRGAPLPLLAGCLCALLSSGRAAAQDSTGVVVGTVISRDGGGGLPFSTIAVEPLGRAIFTDSNGVFRIPALAPGAYRITARELGYQPIDSTVEVHAGQATGPLTFALPYIAHRLPTLPVRGSGECRAPGLPDSGASPALAVLAGQLRSNAERLRLLLVTAPFDYDMEARLTTRGYGGTELEREDVDTLTYASWLDHPYRVGGVVDRRFGGLRRGRHYPGPYIYLPGLEDLADSAFQATHCFRYAGVDQAAGHRVARIDFAPVRGIRSPDVEGSVFIDLDRYIVRRAVFRLTHPERVDPPLRSLEAETRYRELVPLVAVEDSVSAVRTWGSIVTGGESVGREEDHVIAVRFLHAHAR